MVNKIVYQKGQYSDPDNNRNENSTDAISQQLNFWFVRLRPFHQVNHFR